LSDVHFRVDKATDTAVVVNALVDDLRQVSEETGKAIDAIIFSGDLAFSGCSLEDFESAFTNTVEKVAREIGVPLDRIFLAPGNHDICRETVRAFPALQEGLADRLNSTEAVNQFQDHLVGGGAEELLGIKRVENFQGFVSARLPHHDVSHPLCSIGTFVAEDRKVGISLLNSAWRATGESDDVDQGRLLIGERQVDYALKALDGCDLAIAVAHHPLDWLAPFDRASVEPLILGGFHLFCFGHLHEISPKSVASTSGTCVISQSGSMYASRSWHNGYQIIDVDLLSGEFSFNLREYNDRSRRFGPAEALISGGVISFDNPRSISQDDRGQIELFLRQYRQILRERAKEHIDLVNFSDTYTERLLDEFVAPPLYERLVPDPSATEDAPAEREEVSVGDLLNSGDNFVIIGDRKSGRTSLAFHLALELASGRTNTTSIPVFVDIRTYKFNFYDLRRAVLSFYGPAPKGFALEKSFEKGLYTFIVDNLDVYDEALLKKFAEHVEVFENCRWIVIASPSAEGVVRDRLLSEALPSFRRVHVGSLPRKLIRRMARYWAEDRSSDDKDAFEAVINQLNRDGLPKTPYMVALVLWALEQRKAGERLNEALLLRNVIEHLLGRADFTLSTRASFNPTSKELTLQEIAWLLREKAGFVDENELVAHLAAYFGRKRLPFSAADVLTKLLDCGILSRSEGLVAFKYKAFQEYFVALRLQGERTSLNDALSDLEFLKFRRELELLSGLRQKNDDLIHVITKVLTSRVPDRFVKCEAEEIDRLTSKGVGAGTTKAKLNEIRRTRLTDDQVDQIMDEADRRAVARGERPVSASLEEAEGDIYKAALAREAEAIDADSASVGEPLRPSTHMASIDLLAKIVRNSDFTDFDVKGPAAALVLKSWVKIIILMLEEIREIVSKIKWPDGSCVEEKDLEIMNYLLARVLMAMAGQTVVDQLSSPTIADTIAGIIDECDPCTGEKILGSFILEDARYKGWQTRWRDMIVDRTSSGFVVEAFMDRLWAIVSRRALDQDQSKRVNSIADAIEERLELGSASKSAFLENIRTATNLKRIGDADLTGSGS
jgi:hypothetical protein